jgi:DNA-binding XRE family transcriptional regulator
MADQLRAHLTPEERALAKVRFEDGLSQRDAADVLGISRQAIRTQEMHLMERARAFFRHKGW